MIMREVGIEGILDSLFRKMDKNVILVLVAARKIRSLQMTLQYTWYDGTYLVTEYP